MFKITLGNYTYKLKRLTTGKYYIVREMSHKGFKKWQAGQLQNGFGIVSMRLRYQILIAILIITALAIISAKVGGCDSWQVCNI